MTSSSTAGSTGQVVLAPISCDEAPTLGNLYQLYAHDFSEFVELPIEPNGRFAVSPSDVWWSSAAHSAFFIHAAGALSGFALAQRGSRISGDPAVMDVAEFFVLRGARRRNVGAQAASALLDAFPGRWEIRVRQANAPALAFWSRVVELRTGSAKPRACKLDDVDWFMLACAT